MLFFIGCRYFASLIARGFRRAVLMSGLLVLLILIQGGGVLPTGLARANVYGDFLNSRYAESENDYARAAELLGRVLEALPDDVQIRQEALLSYAYAGRYDAMAELARESQERQSGNLSPENLSPENLSPENLSIIYFIAGLNALVKEDYDQAVEIFSKIPQVRLEKFSIPLVLAWSEIGRGRFDTAIALMEAFDSRGGFAELKSLHLGMILARAGQKEAAETAFLGTKKHAGQLPLRIFRAYIRLKADTGKQGVARDLITDYLAANPDQPLLEADLQELLRNGALKPLVNSPAEGAGDGIFHLASALYSQSNEYGFLYARLAHWVAPDLPGILIFLAAVMEDHARFEAANRMYDQLGENSPYFWRVQLQRAENLYALGKEKDAIDMLSRMTVERPSRYDALVALGDIYRRQEDYKHAAKSFDKAIARLNPVRPEHFYIYYYAGMAHERAKQWAQAEPNFLKALELRPDNPNILNYLGYSWVEMGIHIEQAQEMIRRAVSQQRGNGYIVDSLGWVYYKIGKYDAAVEALEQAVFLLPQDPTVNDHLGDAYWRTGRKREARYQWLRASRMKPEEEQKLAIDEKLANGLPDKNSDGN